MGMKRTLSVVSLLLVSLPALAMTHIHRGPTAHRVTRHLPIKHFKKSAPRAMDSARATQIQTALIRKGYLSGSPSGAWDSETQSAMQKFQSDNGWQTKLTPDSRAIIRLGLGSSTTPAAAWVSAPGDPSVAASAGPGTSVPQAVDSQ